LEKDILNIYRSNKSKHSDICSVLATQNLVSRPPILIVHVALREGGLLFYYYYYY